jgi:HK97 family phage prohead protease
MKRELRIVANSELRTANDGKLTGYAAVFNSLSEDLGGFRERILPGAFSRTIKTADVRALINHDPSRVLGRTTTGSLTLAEDSKGLKFTCSLPATTYASDLIESVRRGDISQCSFGFQAREDRWVPGQKQGNSIRELIDVDLFDVSAVTYPAYTDTSIQERSLAHLGFECVGSYGRIAASTSSADDPCTELAEARNLLNIARTEQEKDRARVAVANALQRDITADAVRRALSW